MTIRTASMTREVSLSEKKNGADQNSMMLLKPSADKG